MNAFSAYHPINLLFYFVSVIGIAMFTVNPILLGLALCGGLCFCAFSSSHKSILKGIGFGVLVCLCVTLVNPLFSHNGVTPLFFLGGNPVTLEAILYGDQIAIMLLSVMVWFVCFERVMTEDKFLYLFGRVSPKLAQLLSSALRFVPLFARQAKRIREAQTAMGLFSGESYAERLHGSGRIFSVLVGWSLEQAVAAGAAMKARGYGLPRRSHFSRFRFTGRDGLFLAVLVLLWMAVLPALYLRQTDFAFYPQLAPPALTPALLLCYIGFGLLCFLPAILEGKELLKWNYYRSKI